MRQDPKITSFTKPLSIEEIIESDAINFADAGFVFGVLPLINGKVKLIPPQVGKLTGVTGVDLKKEENPYPRKELELIDCMKVLSQQALESAEYHSKKAITSKKGRCLDPQEANLSWYSSAFKT